MSEKVGAGGIPRDKEQIAAEQGVVTNAQAHANEVMRAQIADKVQTVIDDKMVDVNREALQSGFEERRRMAIAARPKDNQPAPEKKKPWWKFW